MWHTLAEPCVGEGDGEYGVAAAGGVVHGSGRRRPGAVAQLHEGLDGVVVGNEVLGEVLNVGT